MCTHGVLLLILTETCVGAMHHVICVHANHVVHSGPPCSLSPPRTHLGSLSKPTVSRRARIGTQAWHRHISPRNTHPGSLSKPTVSGRARIRTCLAALIRTPIKTQLRMQRNQAASQLLACLRNESSPIIILDFRFLWGTVQGAAKKPRFVSTAMA